MSSIIVQQRRVWTRQPPGPAQLDKKLPVLFFVPCSAAGHVDLITGVTGEVVGNPATEANSIGVLTRFGAGKRIRFPPLSVSGTTPITIAWVQEGINPSSYQATADIGYQGGASFLLYNSTADAGYGVSCGVGANASVFPTAGKMIDREINRFALMCSDGLAGGAASFVLFKNGVQHAASPTTLSSPPNPYIEIGSRANGSDSFFGRIGNFAILKGADRSIALELSANPWQIFAKRDRYAFVNLSGGSASYTITPTGSISLSGISTQIKNKIFQASGTVTLTGSASLSLTNGAIEYTISPSGFITYSGTYKARIVKALSPSGTIVYSGNAIRSTTHIQTSSGLITFSGSAPLYVPGSYIPTTSILLTGVGK